jgi:hypothetical protein
MFARLFLLILGFISFAWIIFIGYDLLDQKDKISPQHIFSEEDGEILIINRSAEVHLEELNYTVKPEIQELFSEILKNIYPNERIYVSEKRNLLMIEIPNIWTEEGVKKYFKTKAIEISSVEDKKFKLKNQYSAFYKKNFLLVSTENTFFSHKENDWPLWDNKASASIVHLSQPLKSTNIYFKGDNTISYQTKYGKEFNSKKIDDKDLFAQFLPSSIENYHFMEKKFAKNNKILAQESPLYQWMEDGMVMFTYQNTLCILSDYNKMIDPINILISNESNPSELTNKFENIQLTKSFPSDLNKGFYIGKLSDKVILSENKEILEKISADYQLGNTLVLNKEKSDKIFTKMPKKVSERNENMGKTYSLTSYKNLLIRTEFFSISSEILNSPTQKTDLKNNSFAFNSKIKRFLGNGNILYVISEDKQILAISNKKLVWKKDLEGEIIGIPKLIDVFENGNLQLLVNTNEKIYLLTSEGKNVNEFPVSIKSVNPVSFYRWNNKANFLVVNSSKELNQIDQNGRIIKKLKLPFSEISNEIDVYKNQNALSAIITGENSSQTVDLEKNKLIKSTFNLPKTRLQLKVSSGFYYFHIENNTIFRTDQLSNRTLIYSGSEIKNMKKLYKGKQQLICFQDKNQILAIDESGQITLKIKTTINEIEDFDMITHSSGTFLAVIDEIENDIYLFDSNGNQLNEKAYEGKKAVKLSIDKGKIILSSMIQNNVVQYYDVISKP